MAVLSVLFTDNQISDIEALDLKSLSGSLVTLVSISIIVIIAFVIIISHYGINANFIGFRFFFISLRTNSDIVLKNFQKTIMNRKG